MRFLNRRPSPAIVISSVALFMSLGGVGYAATTLANNSVGNAQLKNGSVSYKKIQPGAVGNVRANTQQMQERVGKSCGTNTAISAIAQSGAPTCSPTLPNEIGTTSNTASVPTTATAPVSVTSTTLTAGATYLGLANPTITVTPATGASGSQAASVTCTLGVGSNTSTRTITVTTPNGTTAANAALPLQLTGTGGAAGVSCSSKHVGTANGAAPAVSVTSAVNAIQIQ